MWHTDRWTGPVFDNQGLNSMIADGLSRLSTMQRGDGGWGWWPGSSDSDEYMSAYAVYGLETARAAGLEVPGDELANGDNYLAKRIAAEDNLHLLADMIYSLSLSGDLPKTAHDLAAGRLFQQRSRLTPYSQSLLAMALWNCGEKDKANVLLRNLENSVKVDPGNNTAYFVENWDWWDWWDNEDCTNATALRAFLLIDPANPLAAQLMNRMLKNARGNHWDSTRSTAETIYALAEYSRVNHELDADYTLKVTLNGNLTRTYHVNRENALFFDNRFEADDTFLKDGANTLTIEKQGTGTLYWNAYSQYFSEEEPIAASGNEISINRRYFKLTRNPSAIVADTSEDTASATPTPQEYSRTELRDGDHLQSGDLVEVELVIQSKNAYSYLVFEDMKPAGLEPVDLRSGYGWGDGFCSNVELRDDKVAFFVDDLPQGQRVLRYQMRAEIPGRFHALPTNGYAMYAPEVRAISNEMRLEVHD